MPITGSSQAASRLRRSGLVLVSVTALSASGWLAVDRLAEGDEHPAVEIQQSLEEDDAKPRASGRVGDFLVIATRGQAEEEANIFGCQDGKGTESVPAQQAKSDELWSDAFDKDGVAWSCTGQGVVLVNNEGGEGHAVNGDGSLLARGYITKTPIAVARDTAQDRLERIEVEGHPALLEHPIEGYPYARASLIVIERMPDGSTPGIVTIVESAPSAEAAIKHAEEIIP